MINLVVNKFADKNYLFLQISNILKYTISITNNGDETANNIKVIDLISDCDYINNQTIKVNGCIYENYNSFYGILINSLQPNTTTIITLEVHVNEKYVQNTILNRAIVSYTDTSDFTMTIESNEVIIPVINLDVCLSKTVDKTFAFVGDILSYYVLIRNNSNIPIDNVVFSDILPSGLQIIPSSVKIGPTPQFLSDLNSVNLGTIASASSLVIVFQAVILSICYDSMINSVAHVEYSYTVVDNGINIISIGESYSCNVSTRIFNSTHH